MILDEIHNLIDHFQAKTYATPDEITIGRGLMREFIQEVHPFQEYEAAYNTETVSSENGMEFLYGLHTEKQTISVSAYMESKTMCTGIHRIWTTMENTTSIIKT